ncbi:hypothetical protein MTO96_038569, partial [Rhipicephalus appendiculatus]
MTDEATANAAAVTGHLDDCAWTEDGWHTILSRRKKKNQQSKQKEADKGPAALKSDHPNARENTAEQGFRRKRQRRRHLPPLPKDDIKIIMRPHKGLVVKDLLGSEISVAIIDACQRKFDGRNFMLRVHPGSNIIIVSTPEENVARHLREITRLNIRGHIYPFNAYVADPEDVLRGVIHGKPTGTSQNELMASLRIRTQGVTIERARMLGSSKTALITFTGSTLPRCAYFMGAEALCHPYKPTTQVCKVCRSTEHRSDVCPSPNAKVCPKCGTIEPQPEHECTPKCAICGEGHATGETTVVQLGTRIASIGKPEPEHIRDYATVTKGNNVGKSTLKKSGAPHADAALVQEGDADPRQATNK